MQQATQQTETPVWVDCPNCKSPMRGGFCRVCSKVTMSYDQARARIAEIEASLRGSDGILSWATADPLLKSEALALMEIRPERVTGVVGSRARLSESAEVR